MPNLTTLTPVWARSAFAIEAYSAGSLSAILRLRDNPMKYLCFGFANTIVGLEIGVIHSDSGEPAIFHAMKCRKKYEKYLVLEGDYYDYE